MVFSFFRKKEPPTGPPPVKRKVAKPQPNPETLQPMSAKIPPRPAVAPNAKPPASAARKAPEKAVPKPFADSATGGLEVAAGAVELSGAAEEAAILYANNQIQPAIAVLLQAIGEKSGATNRSLWLMLFDLYQLQGMQQEFDDLALDFVVKFERSPPPWRDQQKVKPAAKAARPAAAGTINLSGKLTAACKPQLDQLARNAENKSPARLDLSKITGLTTEGANTLVEALQRLRRAKSALSLSGAESLTEVAAQAMEPAKGTEKKAYCQLLLELYQVLGRQVEFDDLAVQYAVETEVSPPSWEAAPNWRTDPDVAKGEAGETVAEAVTPADKFALMGEMTGSTDPQLRDLVDYAAARLNLEVDMADLRRLDFVCCGMLLNILTGIKQGGKAVRLSGANEMVFALCRVMGVDQVATLVKSKHH